MSEQHIKPVRGEDYMVAVCRKLGVDPQKVRKVTITAEVGDLVRVHVELIGDDRLYDLTDLLSNG